jgi:putative glutamine amidotransferase
LAKVTVPTSPEALSVIGGREVQDARELQETSVTAETRPLVAVTTSEMRHVQAVHLTPEGEPPQEEMALGLKYLRAIEAAGGVPVVVPPLGGHALSALLDRVSGVCLSGGPDLDPIAYGASRHGKLGPMWRDLDEFELALASAADARRLPILAICRGLQVLNVTRGGTLHQHLPDVVGTDINHRQDAPGHEATHGVTLEGDSRLSRILDTDRTSVNSFHHQAVASLGDGLTITARADDATVEAIEALDREFVLGVQWHAECLTARLEHAALFDAFIQAARRFTGREAKLARAA